MMGKRMHMFLVALCLVLGCVSVTGTRIRLVGGSGPWEGTIQVYHSGWGTVCDDNFDEPEARVVCRMLGYDEPAIAYSSAHFGSASGSILMDDLNCNGGENDIAQCLPHPWGVHNCQHTEDAGVRCSVVLIPTLIGGAGNYEGILQLSYNGRHSSFCDTHFTELDAKVVCRSLGLSGGVVVKGGSFGEISYAQILTDRLDCIGNETEISKCTRFGSHSTNCTHAQDVGISCDHTPVRLVGGSIPSKGLLQVQNNGVWGTVCSSGFTQNEADVVCRMLGFNNTHISMDMHAVGGSGPIASGNLSCSGNETDISKCSTIVWDGNCTHSNDVGIACSPTDVRLIRGSGPWEGTLQVKMDGLWGEVCDPDFGDAEANVVCRMLGYTKRDAVHVVYHSSYFGTTSAAILDNITCTGYEHDISACAKVFHTTCPTSEHVGLRCEGLQVRLVDGANSGQGRVEVLHGGEWGSVCDTKWDDNEATVICRMLTPYPYDRSVTGKATNGSMFGYGPGRVWLSDVSCHGNESDITECTSDFNGGINCDHSNDAGVICNTNVPKRLVGGTKDSEGTVEFLDSNGRWNSFCQEEWNTTDAHVVCAELGYWSSHPNVLFDAFYGRGTGTAYKTLPECNGNEGSLEACQAVMVSPSSCLTNIAVGVACNPRPLDNSQIRLVDGPGPWKGRLELKTNGVWGSLCYDHWNPNNTILVCETLHYMLLNSQAFPTSKGFGAVHYRSLECSDSDSNLGQCKANTNVSECSSPNTATVGIDCSDGQMVRLENNIVKLYLHNSTAAVDVCYDGVNDAAAKVMCSMAGYPNSTPWREPSSLGSNSTLMYTSIGCDGWERHIGQCTTRSGGNCSNSLTLRCFNCTRVMTSSSGTIVSEHYDQGTHDPDVDCLYVIRPGPGVALKLDFNDLDLSGDGDFIEIRDGDKGRQLGYFSSNTDVPYLVSTTGFYIRFKTNSNGQARGFNASWSELRIQDTVHMGCGPGGWEIAVNMTLLRRLYPDSGVSQIKLSDQRCTGIVEGDLVLFKQSYTECSSSIQTNPEHVVYTNELVYPEASNPFPIVVRGYRWKVEVECDVSRQETVSTGFTPNRTVIHEVPHVTGTSHYDSDIRFYTDGSYYKEVPGNPVTLKTGDDVFVKVQLNSNDPHVKMRLDTCYARPDVNSPPSLTYTLIQNGCVLDSYTSILSQGIHETRFVFNAFEFPAGHNNVFISCNATYCQTNDVTNACNQICIGAPQIIGRSLLDIWNDFE